jgi:hypothetical protein
MLFIDAGQRGELQHPKDFHPNSHKGVDADPQISRHAMPAPPGMAYTAVGMQRVKDRRQLIVFIVMNVVLILVAVIAR